MTNGIPTTAGTEITEAALDAAIVEIVAEDRLPIYLDDLGTELSNRGMFPANKRLFIFGAIGRVLASGAIIKPHANHFARPDYVPTPLPDPMGLLRTEMSLARRKKADTHEVRQIVKARARAGRSAD